MSSPEAAQDPDLEFDRQRDTLLDRGYPQLAGLSRAAFASLCEPLRRQTYQVSPGGWTGSPSSTVPFVLVVDDQLVPSETLVPTLTLAEGDRPGIVDRNHGESGLAPYGPIQEVRLPGSPTYLLLGVERGEEFCGVRPEEALPEILGRGRTPLTIAEGIALVTHFPEALQKNKCFMLSGSRRGDRRVPALWISAKAPKLGWCWDGNPHNWLGTASAAARLGHAC